MTLPKKVTPKKVTPKKVTPKKVTIVEVGPRDGLQNEKQNIPTAVKIDFINQLSATGLKVIEATSFVSPKWVPQLSDHKEVLMGIKKVAHVQYPVLVPNLMGLNNAIAAGAKTIAVFTTPSELFCKTNINCTVAESLTNIAEIIAVCKQNKIAVRGYLSCVLGCPYEGKMSPEKVLAIAEKLLGLGCEEISLGDTIGVGTAASTQNLLAVILKRIPSNKIAVHFHDTYGQALTNIYVALQHDIATIDSAVAGLGGCPYAKGATGNVATEDVIYLLQGLGIETGVDILKLIAVGNFICEALGRPTQSKVSRALSPSQA